MPAAADRLFHAIIRINGVSNPTLSQCLQNVTVTEDLDRGSSFSIRLTLCRNADGSWPLLGDPTLRAWNRVTILAGFADRTDTILDGYLSHTHITTNKQTNVLTGEFRGVDASYVMNLEERCVVWEGKTYTEIAEEICAGTYGFRFIGPRDEEPADGPPPSVTQRHTDLRFLRELARRMGYEFYVRGADAHFHPPELDTTPQKLIAVNFGEETNCHDFSVDVDGTRPTESLISRINPTTGETETATCTESGDAPLGTTPLSSLRGAGFPQTRVMVRRHSAPSLREMERRAQAVLRRNGWWITARGALDGLRYGRVLRSKKLVTIKGFGTEYNGVYYVRKVEHALTTRTYTMNFEAVRNSLGQLGTEDFEGERPDAIGMPAASAGGADDDLVTVAESGPLVAPA